MTTATATRPPRAAKVSPSRGRPPSPAPWAIWHQCRGRFAHPAHRALHQHGFWTEGQLPIDFIEGFCLFPDGPQQGQPITMIPWMREGIYELFRLRADGLRQYRRALWGVAKKNGKTLLAALLALYFLVADDEPTPFIPCAASADEQADLVFGAARKIVEIGQEHPQLGEFWGNVEAFDKEILVPMRPGSKIQRVPASGGKLDGPNVYVGIFDELHEWTSAANVATYTVINRGMIARANSLAFAITTAGWDLESLCGTLYEYGKRVETNPALDESFMFLWYEAADGLDWHSAAGFKAANPSAPRTVNYRRFREDTKPPMKRETGLRYHFNQWTSTEESWLPPGAWDACQGGVTIDPALPSVIAIDASTKYDSTAVGHYQIRDEGDGVVVEPCAVRIWERPINPATGQPVDGWRVPIAEVKNHIRAIAREHNVETIGFDPMFITWVAAELEEELKIPAVEINQGVKMAQGAQSLYERVVQGRLRHNGDPILRRHVASAVAKEADRGGWRLVKGRTKRKIDGAIVLAMCAYLTLQPDEDDQGETNLY